MMPSAFSTTNTQEADDVEVIFITLGNCIKKAEASNRSFKRQFRAVIAVMIAVCSVSTSWAFVGYPKYQRMGLIHQEDVAWK
ncbi:hypothetical protein [Agrobacterium pusense]|uniref:hypothetical protein n=1 Tax=Agrobacterium pusense TaxID=648995 RepID=UPI0012EA144A|nr:hypothetical protein [Agrobacterium pusense]QWW75880.1 hypothetical protein KP800_21825 [Agrobacterium pusense]